VTDRDPVEVSVIIPFKNAAPYLRDQLNALAAQELDRAWEVIAVDDSSDDDSRAIALEFCSQLNIAVLTVREGGGQARACNVGAREAGGTKLVFVDADDEVAPGYLAAMTEALDRFDFVTSSFDHRALNPPWVWGAHGTAWRDTEDPIPPMFGFLPFTGASIGVTRKTFEAAGGFPEEFRYALDIGFSWNAQLSGADLHHVPGAVYRYRYRTSLWGLYRQGRGWGAELPLVYRRYRAKGMSRRPLRDTAKLWIRLPVQFAGARSRSDLAPLAVQTGLLVGRLLGSVRHRVVYL
jgi:glycosyltransferase involved in cell wall biosynthesis